MRLFLDANVIFSAVHSPGGRSHALFRLAQAGLCELLSSAHAIGEAHRNLALKSPTKIDELAQFLEVVTPVPEPDPRLVTWAAETGLPDNDAPILAAAVAARVDALVTGDRKHFGPLFGITFGGVEAIPLSEALRRFL